MPAMRNTESDSERDLGPRKVGTNIGMCYMSRGRGWGRAEINPSGSSWAERDSLRSIPSWSDCSVPEKQLGEPVGEGQSDPPSR